VPSLFAIDDPILAEHYVGMVEDGAALSNVMLCFCWLTGSSGRPFKSHQLYQCITLREGVNFKLRSGNARWQKDVDLELAAPIRDGALRNGGKELTPEMKVSACLALIEGLHPRPR